MRAGAAAGTPAEPRGNGWPGTGRPISCSNSVRENGHNIVEATPSSSPKSWPSGALKWVREKAPGRAAAGTAPGGASWGGTGYPPAVIRTEPNLLRQRFPTVPGVVPVRVAGGIVPADSFRQRAKDPPHAPDPPSGGGAVRGMRGIRGMFRPRPGAWLRASGPTRRSA